ncbi:MAG: flavodoxin domain-containing protein [Oscillospiraceae bacterium]|nr:flavodoxin domain-containing protein [Oscillospiraceae bacterium]
MTPDIIILYNSRTGFTQQYAELLAAELNCPVLPWKDAPADLSGYGAVVFGSRLHAGIFDGWKKARKLLARRGANKVVLFATGAMPNEAEDQIQKTWAQNLTPEERKSIPHFYLQAGLLLEKLGLGDRAMLKAAAWAMGRKQAKTPEDEAFRDAISRSYDISDPKYLQPLADCLRTLR